jgi:hypothetical protein
MTKQPWNQGHSIKIKFLNPDNAVIYIYKKDEEEKRDLDLRYLDFIIKEGEID